MIATIDTNTPFIADADIGYRGPTIVARTVEPYVRSGVAGMHIEDQIQRKRCHHLKSKQLVDLDTFGNCIRAAVAARKRVGSDIVIIARIDSLQNIGYEEANCRLK